MNLVEVKDFSFSYPECSHKVLDHANLKIEEGDVSNDELRHGADCGKSTLSRQLKTVLAPRWKVQSGADRYRGCCHRGHRSQDTEPGNRFCHAESG
ncbi:MAG: hypothetical protein ACLUVM_00590 [Blautia faecis]